MMSENCHECSLQISLLLCALLVICVQSRLTTYRFFNRYSVMDSDICVAKFAINCIGKVGIKCKFAATSCLDILVELLSLDLDYTIPSIFEAIKGSLLLTCRYFLQPNLCYSLPHWHP